ncbi:MAG: insulinase family protein [Muribaculaceae bacterium]|nr:insulinase family protein [Muribaculaceae bacterium]
MSNLYHIFTLPNGLRVVSLRSDSQVAYTGMAVNAGSRDELPDRQGLAHFVEHTIFKGTRSRRSYQIANRMEAVGGELNAYTSKEETLIYTNAPAGYTERAFELISDLISNSVFPQVEIDREREVVVEEIHSYLDSPSDAVFDEFDENIYAGSGLAHNILGTPESVRALTGTDCRAFIDRWYTPTNMVLYCVDPSPTERIERLALKHFGHLHFDATPHNRELPPKAIPFDIVRPGDNHQANTIIGARVFGRNDPRRFALFLLNNYLGGPCMNSRLNQELRDRRGLVYTVDSSVSLLSDTGVMLVYFGCDPANVARCRRLIDRELDRLAQSVLPLRTFEAAKRQYCGQLTVSTDHRESRAMSLGKSVLYYGEVHDANYTRERIMEVTPEQIREVAELLAPQYRCSLSLR